MSGFTLIQALAEHRALRASVLRLWTLEIGEVGSDTRRDLTRCNEAIDQLLAESMVEFVVTVDNAKDMFIGILGHDLRNPLGGIQATVQLHGRGGGGGSTPYGRTVEVRY